MKHILTLINYTQFALYVYRHVDLHCACDIIYYEEIISEFCIALELLNTFCWEVSKSLVEVCLNRHYIDIVLA